MQAQDTRQPEYTEIPASCGHTLYVRLDKDPVVAADMIAVFMGEPCAMSTCPAAQAARAARTQTRGICWSDENRGR